MNILEILRGGDIYLSEVEAIRAEIYEDGTIEEDELRDLYRLKNSAASFVTAFGALVVQATVDFALNDPNTPGVVDANEAAVLNELIGADGTIDEYAEQALRIIRSQATSVHPSLIAV